ncbi:pimeloyl-ACP methyl ester carboxylesterase [Streptomonospora nanhaiensis]|uniref:Pimeloyl-ACP methyl ester carboxylesterase n=1 Tax=Streptomonospora nanhaiensis TaxID=1323731 RepID=A0A853BVD9_9ACTN|nr:alpha/beta hydrolase [Streptomonospora nanhaiensis]NYI98715.1 pimeloyl-ACP methyl ester carboxylesterase [Streptomonospora nanhaiensis]
MTDPRATTLVFLPCLSGAPWTPRQLAPYRHRPVRTPALPDGVDDVERYADHVAASLADLDRPGTAGDPGGYVLVGDSFGANVALALAVRRPSGLRGLVLSGGFAANPVTSPLRRRALQALGRMRGPLYRGVALRAHARTLASPHDFAGEVGWSTADSRRLFLDHTPAASYGARLAAAFAADYTGRLARVRVPTLVLTPAHDVLIGPDAARILREGIPDAREVVLPRTGHMFRFSHPDTYGRAVEEFLAERVDPVAAAAPGPDREAAGRATR